MTELVRNPPSSTSPIYGPGNVLRHATWSRKRQVLSLSSSPFRRGYRSLVREYSRSECQGQRALYKLQVPPAELAKLIPRKNLLNQPNFKSSGQMSIAEIGYEFVHDFESSGIQIWDPPVSLLGWVCKLPCFQSKVKKKTGDGT